MMVAFLFAVPVVTVGGGLFVWLLRDAEKKLNEWFSDKKEDETK